VRKAALLLASVLLLVAVGSVVVAEIPEGAGDLPAGARTRLDAYLADAFWPGTAKVQAVARARRPWRFEPSMSGQAFGDSVYFQTEEDSSALAPLPYPPDRLWCVLLSAEGAASGKPGGGDRYGVAFVALHIDLYNADWIVHQGRGNVTDPEFLEGLSAIGCDLGLDRAGPPSPSR
jgi:hypothetical protein